MLGRLGFDMVTVSEFCNQLTSCTTDDIVERYLLSGTAVHVSSDTKNIIGKRLCEKYRVSLGELTLYIVGSAKLGFSLVEKGRNGGLILPRYRQFGPHSDIDVAVIHDDIFDLVWRELSDYVFNRPFLPWDSGRLGDYLVGGRIRPDHFPKNVRLQRCDDWWEAVSNLSIEVFSGRRKVRAGLFRSKYVLSKYLGRAVHECKNVEES